MRKPPGKFDKDSVSVLSASDLRAALGLIHQATSGVLAITEGVHQSVRSTLGLPAGVLPDRAGGLTGRIYGAMRGLNSGIVSGLDGALSMLERRLQHSPEPNPRRLALLAVLNGVMGDRLHASANPLALQMQLRTGGRSLDQALESSEVQFSGHALVLVHGLCMNDQQWASQEDPGHGQALAQALGCTPVYVRYNTGLPIADNGLQLARALEKMQSQWPVPLQRISLLGHSMGGLVARSAEFHGRIGQQSWRGVLGDLVLLGTPNLGAPLERAGFGVDRLLESLPYARHFARIGKLRSVGITDLRHGHVTAEAELLPLPTDLRCRALAGVLAGKRSPISERLLGDGLVPLHSALGRGQGVEQGLRFSADSTEVLYATGHLDLLRSEQARQRLIEWLRG